MIFQSCNALHLCISWKRFFIYNPTTKKFKWLFVPSPECKDRRLLGISLAFDPLKSTHHKFFINIYSSKTNSWSFSKIKFTWDWSVNFELGVFFKGVIHWDSYLLESIWFDVENQWLKTMRMPIVGDAGYRYFRESRGY
ncbi:hypothetical protein Goari_014670 [Gossypium aridum]|uniref:F-box associated beta-propeller type 1 domain-containing protein n=1 Tax=Gossypium aridum TaxID=34290 RepID=A0A7J8XIH5_GOSAI|nr:hypothetical protein [Gossypium aridum]